MYYKKTVTYESDENDNFTHSYFCLLSQVCAYIFICRLMEENIGEKKKSEVFFFFQIFHICNRDENCSFITLILFFLKKKDLLN
jgi:hypothetical protein